MAPFADEAVALADAGFHLLPIIRGTRKPALPRTGRGHAFGASRDPELVRRWFSGELHDVAIVPWLSGHVVLDVDCKHGPHAARNLVAIEQEHGYWPWRFSDVTATATSANGGWHYWFSLPAGVDHRELRGGVAPSVEIQRYLAISPPTSGRRWIRPPASDIIQIPDGLLELARKPRRPDVVVTPAVKLLRQRAGHGRRNDLAGLKRGLGKQHEGNRNGYLYWAARKAAEHVGRGECTIADALSLATVATDIGMPMHEAERTIESALRAVLGELGVDFRAQPARPHTMYVANVRTRATRARDERGEKS